MMQALVRFREVGILIVSLVLVVAFSLDSNGVWLATGNLTSVVQIMAVLTVMAIGSALVLTVAEIDLSPGSVFAVGAFLYLGLSPVLGPVPAMVCALLGAALIGALNGYLVSYLGIPSLVVTLGTLFMFRGIALGITDTGFFFTAGARLRESAVFHIFGGSSILGLNDGVLWAAIVLVVAHGVLFATPLGNRILAVGGAPRSAHSRGVAVRRLKMGTFVAAAFLAGFAGILEASTVGVADGTFGQNMELEAIAAAVLGGCALMGGRSSVIGTTLAAFVLTGIKSFLIVKGIQSQWYILLLGFIVVAALLVNRFVDIGVQRFGRRRGPPKRRSVAK